MTGLETKVDEPGGISTEDMELLEDWKEDDVDSFVTSMMGKSRSSASPSENWCAVPRHGSAA